MPEPITIEDLQGRILRDTFGQDLSDLDAFLLFAILHHYQIELDGSFLADRPHLKAGDLIHADTQRGCAAALASIWENSDDERSNYAYWYWRWVAPQGTVVFGSVAISMRGFERRNLGHVARSSNASKIGTSSLSMTYQRRSVRRRSCKVSAPKLQSLGAEVAKAFARLRGRFQSCCLSPPFFLESSGFGSPGHSRRVATLSRFPVVLPPGTKGNRND
jgi:hypothetical protein